MTQGCGRRGMQRHSKPSHLCCLQTARKLTKHRGMEVGVNHRGAVAIHFSLWQRRIDLTTATNRETQAIGGSNGKRGLVLVFSLLYSFARPQGSARTLVPAAANAPCTWHCAIRILSCFPPKASHVIKHSVAKRTTKSLAYPPLSPTHSQHTVLCRQ